MTTATKKTTTGSLLPVGGTTVGLPVGPGVGLAMSANTGDGKTAGDRIVDGSETVGNFGKNYFKRVFG